MYMPIDAMDRCKIWRSHCKKSIFALSYFNTLNLRKMQFLLSLRVFLLEYADYNFKLKHLSKIFWVNHYR
jgi:hypothetical protein